ncbi:MAG: trypsin-like serine protease, partial [Elusimicrobiaceae bacterium]|nr:trypsin-like serine protease [Elusimicrobiaceae bacterium]
MIKRGILLISLLLLTLCANLRAQETDSWVVFDSNGEVVDNVEISADEEDDFLDEELSVPGKLAQDDEYYDENIYLADWDRIFHPVQEITGKAVGFEKAAVIVEVKDKNRQNRGFCSGAIVAPYTVLTAAHCIHNEYKKLRPMQIIAAGLPKTEEGYPTSTVAYYSVPEEFKKCYEKETVKDPRFGLIKCSKYDYAFLLLEKDLGKQTGYFGVKTFIEGGFP